LFFQPVKVVQYYFSLGIYCADKNLLPSRKKQRMKKNPINFILLFPATLSRVSTANCHEKQRIKENSQFEILS
jgi:hypothetical protein